MFCGLPIHSNVAMIFFCIFIAMALPFMLSIFASICGRTIKADLTSFILIMGLAGWTFGYAFFSTP